MSRVHCIKMACVLTAMFLANKSPNALAAPFPERIKTSETLSNGAAVYTLRNSTDTIDCIKFSNTDSRPFLGYGLNVALPGKESSLDRVVNNLQYLHMNWIRTDFFHPFRVKLGAPGPVMLSDQLMYEKVKDGMTTYLQAKPFIVLSYKRLHAAGVNIMTTLFTIPDNYKTSKTSPQGQVSNAIDAKHIRDFAQFYVAYLRVLNEFDILPDMVELVNEPDGTWDPFYKPAEFEMFEHLVVAGLLKHHLTVNLVAPGTSNIPAAPVYLRPIVDSGDISALAGISAHAYFAPNHHLEGSTIYNNEAPDNLPAFRQIVAASKAYQKPVFITEFGGLANVVEDKHPDPALALKAALDLVRNGASAAILWGLIGDHYCILDNEGNKLPAYFAIQSLTTNIPAEARILKAQYFDVKNPGHPYDSMASLGYGAFEKDGRVVIGLSNPSKFDKYVAIVFPQAETTIKQILSFDQSSMLDSSTNLKVFGDSVRVRIPPNTGLILNAVEEHARI